MISVISHGGEGGTLFSHWLFLIPPPRVGYVIDVMVESLLIVISLVLGVSFVARCIM